MASRAEKLAAALLADRERAGTPTGKKITSCAMCDRDMVYRGRDYCSDRCEQYAADGFPKPDPAFARKVDADERARGEASCRSWRTVVGAGDDLVGEAYYAKRFDRYWALRREREAKKARKAEARP